MVTCTGGLSNRVSISRFEYGNTATSLVLKSKGSSSAKTIRGGDVSCLQGDCAGVSAGLGRATSILVLMLEALVESSDMAVVMLLCWKSCERFDGVRAVKKKCDVLHDVRHACGKLGS